MQTHDDLGRRIKNELNRLNWNQSDLARASGVPVNNISKYINGANEPKRDNLDAIADALGVSPVYLAYGINETNGGARVDVRGEIFGTGHWLDQATISTFKAYHLPLVPIEAYRSVSQFALKVWKSGLAEYNRPCWVVVGDCDQMKAKGYGWTAGDHVVLQTQKDPLFCRDIFKVEAVNGNQVTFSNNKESPFILDMDSKENKTAWRCLGLVLMRVQPVARGTET